MKYDVVWRPSAEQGLAQIWLLASDRNRVTTATYRIDQALSRHPRSFGRRLYGTTYSGGSAPLAVVYEIIEDDLRVNVLTVWRP